MQSPPRRAGIFYLCVGLLLVAFGTLSHAWVHASQWTDMRVGLISAVYKDGIARSIGDPRFQPPALVAYWAGMMTLLLGGIAVVATIGAALEGRSRPDGAPLPWITWARVCGWSATVYAIAVAGVVAAMVSYPIMPGESAALAFTGAVVTIVGTRKLDQA